MPVTRGCAPGRLAAEQGASVLVLVEAPGYLPGGNTYFTGGLFLFAYDRMDLC